MTLLTFRDELLQRVPWWLRGFFGGRLIYSIGIQLDAIGDAVVHGTRLRMPGKYGYESLPYIARERDMLRGLDESEASWSARMENWRATARLKGNPIPLLDELRAVLINRHTSAWFEIIYNNGRTFTLNAAGEHSRSDNAWDWDSDSAAWSRFWVVIHAGNWVDDDTWGDSGTWGDGGTIGSDMTPEEANLIQNVVAKHTPLHAQCVRVIVVLNESEWASNQPDGTWQLWGNRHPNQLCFMDGR